MGRAKQRKFFRKIIGAMIEIKQRRKNKFLKVRIETDRLKHAIDFEMTDKSKTPKRENDGEKMITYIVGRIPVECKVMGIENQYMGRIEYERINVSSDGKNIQDCECVQTINVEWDKTTHHKILYSIMQLNAYKGLRQVGVGYVKTFSKERQFVLRSIEEQIELEKKGYRTNLKKITNTIGKEITKSLDEKTGIYGYAYMQVLISAQESMMTETNMFPR